MLSPRTLRMNARSARVAIFIIFAINGIASASWFVRIPAMQERLDLSTATLGMTLLGLPVGAIIAMPIAGTLVPHFGSRRMTTTGGVACCLSLCLLGFAFSAPVLLLFLVLFGVSNALLDVSMNAQGVAVEKHYGRSIMLSLHGGFSMGGMAGALVGGFIASRDIAPTIHLLAVGVAGAGAVVALRRLLLPSQIDALVGDKPRRVFSVPRSVFMLGIIALCGMLAEGAMSDWTAVYLHDTVGTGPGGASLGYAIFSLTMTIGRLSGDRIADVLGGARVVRIGGCAAAGGLLLAIGVVDLWAALLGFGLVGIGVATVAPIVYSTAGHTRGVAPGTAIAAATTIGYAGFLAGPPLIGVVAGLVTLRGALGVVIILLLLMVVMAGVIQQADHAAASSLPESPDSAPRRTISSR